MNEKLKPCPFCGGFAQLRHGKKYLVPTQSFHDDNEYRLPAGVTCNECNVSVGTSVDISNYPDINSAFRAVAEKASEKWNKRTEAIASLDSENVAYCEWSKTNHHDGMSQPACSDGKHINYGFNFCPYCGKPIRIKEQKTDAEKLFDMIPQGG